MLTLITDNRSLYYQRRERLIPFLAEVLDLPLDAIQQALEITHRAYGKHNTKLHTRSAEREQVIEATLGVVEATTEVVESNNEVTLGVVKEPLEKTHFVLSTSTKQEAHPEWVKPSWWGSRFPEPLGYPDCFEEQSAIPELEGLSNSEIRERMAYWEFLDNSESQRQDQETLQRFEMDERPFYTWKSLVAELSKAMKSDSALRIRYENEVLGGTAK